MSIIKKYLLRWHKRTTETRWECGKVEFDHYPTIAEIQKQYNTLELGMHDYIEISEVYKNE